MVRRPGEESVKFKPPEIFLRQPLSGVGTPKKSTRDELPRGPRSRLTRLDLISIHTCGWRHRGVPESRPLDWWDFKSREIREPERSFDSLRE